MYSFIHYQRRGFYILEHPKRSKPLLLVPIHSCILGNPCCRERGALQYRSPAARERSMCPLRFILVFFSAVLAAYFAWRTARSSQETGFTNLEDDSNLENLPSKDYQRLCSKRMIRDGFWGFVDMASGRYLWRKLREMKNADKAN